MDPYVEIRPAVPDDAEALTHLHLDCWDDAYTGLVPQHILDERRVDLPAQVERRRAWLVQSDDTLLATRDGALIGFVNAGAGRDDDIDLDLELRALYVRAAHWGTGVGHRLLAESVGVRDCYLWVLAGNDRAIGFYERHGFTADGSTLDEPEGRHLRMVRRGKSP